MISNGISTWVNAFKTAILPKERLTVSEWSDKNRILPSKTSSEPGRWRTSRTPYLREIMDELSHTSRTKKVVFKKGAQVGGTECGNNWLGYIADQDPGATLIVWPSLPDVLTNLKLRIAPLIENTPCIKEKIFDSKGRAEGSSARFKNFAGGAWIFSGANSASGLRSIPAKNAFLDEVDGYPDDVEGEGDPIDLVAARSRTYSKRKAFLCSTPTFKGRSKIDKEFRASDQRYYYIPCPHCDEYQVLDFNQLKYQVESDDNGEDKVIECSYYCKGCGEEIQEHHKTKMLAAGEWRKHNPKSDVAGFHLSALYSPLGWFSWTEAAQDFVNATTPEKKKTFTNTVLGETYEEEGESPKFDALYKRREQYNIGTCPNGVVFLTMSVDIQKDRIECEVQGHARNRERWSIEHKVLPGLVTEKQVWENLETFISSKFPHANGYDLPIWMVAIDSGYETQRVYNFCRKYPATKVIPIKGGHDTMRVMIGTPQAVQVKNSQSGKKERRGVRLWPIGVTMIKDELFGDLTLDNPEDPQLGYPKGFIHYPEYDQEYFRQLTAEKKILVKNKQGFTKQVYVKEYERNEILDLHVYNRALSAIIGVDRLSESGWDRLDQQNKLASELICKDNGKEKKKTRKKRQKKKSDFWDN